MGFKSNCRASAPGHGVQQWGDMLGETVCDFSTTIGGTTSFLRGSAIPGACIDSGK